MDEIWLIIIAAIGAFGAGFIDAVVGGGGLLQMPLLFILFPGYTNTTLISSNRLGSCVGTLVSAYQYIKNHRISAKLVIIGACAAAIFAYLGAIVMHKINTETYKPILFIVIVSLAIYTFFNKNLGKETNAKYEGKQQYLAMLLVCIVLGLYNGLIGPGTGSLLLLALVRILGFSFLQASGYAKIINASADMGSLINFIIAGVVWYKLALPMMIMNVAGSYVGSKTAIKNGNELIRKIFMGILAVLLIRFGYDIFFS